MIKYEPKNFLNLDKPKLLEIYCDGSASGNGQTNAKGGWACVFEYGSPALIYFIDGFEKNSTNQRMELIAAINAAKVVKFIALGAIIYTDSAYLYNCWKDGWWVKWELNGWLNSKKEPVVNRDLWEQLIPYFNSKQIKWIKVKGHSGNKLNEIADKLAVAAYNKYNKEG